MTKPGGFCFQTLPDREFDKPGSEKDISLARRHPTGRLGTSELRTKRMWRSVRPRPTMPESARSD